MNYLTVYKSPFIKKRVGKQYDSGYIICDISGINYDCFLSGGVEYDISFEEDFLKLHSNIMCYAYDGTINEFPSDNENILWIKKNIGSSNTKSTTNLHNHLEKYKNIFIKMDIEGAEIEWLESLNENHMNNISQLVIEFHNPFSEREEKIFEKINKTHSLFHFHGNNYAGTRIHKNIVVPNVFECTYVNKKYIQTELELNDELIPSILDYPNDKNNNEILLNHFPFVHFKNEFELESEELSLINLKDYKLLIKFPIRYRKDKFFETFSKYVDNLNDKENTRFIISIDEDDEIMNKEEIFEKIKNIYSNIKICVGHSKSKIEAINADMENENFDILLLASDDMIPQIKGYDTIIRNNMNEYFDDLDGVLFYNDGYHGNKINTLVCCGYNYYKKFNYIYAPEYKSIFCDNEFMEVANMLKKQVYINNIIIKHEHPWNNTIYKYDDLHSRNGGDKEVYDTQIYNERKEKGWHNYIGTHKIRLHILGLPHTITRDEFSHCAYTGKIQRFSPMMRSVGYEVYHYGVETSDSGADKNFNILNLEEWNKLRFISYKIEQPNLSNEDIIKKIKDPSTFIGDLGNSQLPLYKEFNKRLALVLEQNYRSKAIDIVCLPFGTGHIDAIINKDFVIVESGIGYPVTFSEFRIFESYAWLHCIYGKENNMNVDNYNFVVPNYFDSKLWKVNLTPKKKTIGFFGRIYNGKGVHIVVEIARRFPDVDFIICGQGDPLPYLTEANIIYKPPIHGNERSDYLGSLCALLAPTKWIEPFCGVAVEAQLCGTPVLTTDYGAQTETVEPFKTGLHCHTLADYCYGVQMALDGKFDRQYIRDRAVEKYDMYNIAKKYDYCFKNILDISNGKKGWYAEKSHLDSLVD